MACCGGGKLGALGEIADKVDSSAIFVIAAIVILVVTSARGEITEFYQQHFGVQQQGQELRNSIPGRNVIQADSE